MTSTPRTQSYIFDPRPAYPLRCAVKRYWHPDSPYLHDPTALTLILAHGTSFHKEQWEPCLADLEALVARAAPGTVRIREVWAIDCPNHGDSAELNEAVLRLGYETTFPWEDYGRSLHLFLSGLGTGVDVDFSSHTLVGIGHSMGAVGLTLSRGYYPRVRFEALIIAEIMTMRFDFGAAASTMLVGGAEKRRDCWPSKAEAYKLLKARGIWKAWDDRVLRSYVEHGLRALPTLDYPDGVGVTLKCSRIQEAACYRDPLGIERAYAAIPDMVKTVPTHVIYGAVNDYLSAEVKADIVDHQAGGLKNLASYTRVPGVGHLIVQGNPTGLAEKIYDALVLVSKPRPVQKANL